MVEIPRCPNCDRVPNIHGEDGIYQRRCSCGVSGPVAADLSISDALWKEVICRVATTEPPAAGTVRARIPVQVFADGTMKINWGRSSDGKQYATGNGRDIGAEITADIPLPQPVELPGAVETSDGE